MPSTPAGPDPVAVSGAPTPRRVRALVLLTAILPSSMGDEVVLVAAVFRLAETGNSLWVTALLVAQIGPLVLLAPLAGVVLDRFDTGRVLVLAHLDVAGPPMRRRRAAGGRRGFGGGLGAGDVGDGQGPRRLPQLGDRRSLRCLGPRRCRRVRQQTGDEAHSRNDDAKSCAHDPPSNFPL